MQRQPGRGDREAQGTRELSLATLAAVLLCAAEVILIVRVGVGGGAGITAHGALPLPLQDTCLGKPQGCRTDESKNGAGPFHLLDDLQVSLCLSCFSNQVSPNAPPRRTLTALSCISTHNQTWPRNVKEHSWSVHHASASDLSPQVSIYLILAINNCFQRSKNYSFCQAGYSDSMCL